MAHPIQYRPVAQTEESARDQLEELLQTLADSGALRLIKDLVARAGPVSDVLAARLETEQGRNALGNLAVLGNALTELPPDRLHAALGAAARALQTAERLTRREPPGFLQMLTVLRSASVRRALVALLVLLHGLGERLQPGEPKRELARR